MKDAHGIVVYNYVSVCLPVLQELDASIFLSLVLLDEYGVAR